MAFFNIFKKSKKPAAAPAAKPAAKPAAPAPKPAAPAPRTFPPYTGGGVCDVCNQGLNGKQAWIVPNDVFYSSPQWRQHMKGILRMMGQMGTDADIERMRMMDHSAGSAVCQNCIHMFR